MSEPELPTTAYDLVHGNKQHVIHMPTDDHIARVLQCGRFYEAPMLEAIRAYERHGVYLDLGAHCGNHTVFFAEHCPATRVVSVESDPRTFAVLLKNTSMLSNVETINAAVLDRETKVRIERPDPRNTGMNYVELDTDGGIETVRVDALVRPTEKLAVVKIDVEGSEAGALRSFGELLAQQDPLLFIEARTLQEKEEHAEILLPLGYRIQATFNKTPTHLWVKSRSAGKSAHKRAVSLRPISPASINSKQFRVLIFSCQRPKHLTRVLEDILAFRGAHEVSVVVYDDASTEDYTEPKRILKAHGWEYVRAEKNHGRSKFWEWVSRAYGDQKERKEPFFVLLADDMRLCQRFFDRALNAWDSIRDSKKISLCLIRDTGRDGKPCWTPITPVDKGDVEQIGWVDGAILCERKYFTTLDWKVPPVEPSRWEHNPKLGSGVGQNISMYLHSLDAKMYGVKESLLAHIAGPSIMNPDARKDNPLSALQFADGDGVHRGLLEMEAIWVSLASVPRRTAQLKKVVDSLYHQCDRLNVYLNGYSSVPEFLLRPKIVVARSQVHGDRGDAGKFFWSGEVPGYHLTVDDDIGYAPDYVQTLIRKIDHYDRKSVVGVHGVVLAKDVGSSYYKNRHVYRCLGSLGEDTAVHILGTGAMAYHKSTILLTRDLFEIENMADIWLGIAAKKQRVPMVCVQHAERWLLDLDPNPSDSIFGTAVHHDHIQAEQLCRHNPWGAPLLVPGAAQALAGPQAAKPGVDQPSSKPSPLEAIDGMLDSIFTHPGMHALSGIHDLDILVTHLMTLRINLSSSHTRRTVWGPVYLAWAKEYFGKSTNRLTGSLLADKFGWRPSETKDDHPDTWPKIVAFYEEWVRRERE